MTSPSDRTFGIEPVVREALSGVAVRAFARRSRALGGAAEATPIIALTAHTGSADRERSLAGGMDAFLAKPLVVADFYDLLGRLLAR